MSEKTKELRDKCTDREVKFVDLWITQGLTKPEAYKKAGYKATNKDSIRSSVSRMLAKDNVQAYLQAVKAKNDAEINRTSKITRTTQLNVLNDVIALAERQHNPSAMVSAIREQNEMLGYHRQSAPNPEAEAARKQRLDEETQAMREQAKLRVISIAAGP